jgi:hypothetical protein
MTAKNKPREKMSTLENKWGGILSEKHGKQWMICIRRTFDLENENEIPGKNLLKVVKFQNLVEKYCNVWKI